MQRAALPQALPGDNQGRWAGPEPAWAGEQDTDVHPWGRLTSSGHRGPAAWKSGKGITRTAQNQPAQGALAGPSG